MIKILVDSASDLEQAEADALGVNLIPMTIKFDDEEFFDGVNITHREFFEKLPLCVELPATSQINEYRWEEEFSKLTADGSEVLAITISSELSGTFSCALKAAEKFKGVRVVDSLNASLGERILLDYAIRLVKSGKTLDGTAELLEEKRTKIQVLALLDTLKYLKKGGRISSVAAFTGELLSIKPVIAIVDGKVKLVGKAIGSKKGNNLLMQLVDKCGGIDFDMPYTLAYSGLSDENLQRYLKDSAKLWKGKTENIPSHMIGSTIGTHIGAGAIAVAFFSK